MRIVKPDCMLGASARWDRKHLYTAACKLRVTQMEQFDAICEAAGISRYEAIRRFCMAVILHPETLDKLRWRKPRGKK